MTYLEIDALKAIPQIERLGNIFVQLRTGVKVPLQCLDLTK